MAAAAAAADARGLPSAALLPRELREPLRAALERFFASPAAAAADGPFGSGTGTPQQRAEAVADFLCLGRSSAASASSASSARGGAEGEPEAKRSRLGSPRRVLLTGCFDLMHAGHYNALRQARAAFPDEDVVLVAGVHSDEAIEEAKGAPTVLKHAERVELVKACRWVDEVAEGLPYEVPVSLLDRLRCDVAVHGDDLPRVPGGGLFDEVRAAGRLKIVKRTEGTSTTMLIGRLMSMSKDHLMRAGDDERLPEELGLVSQTACAARGGERPLEAPLWMLLPTMSRMVHFYGDRQQRLASAKKVVYAPGEWDLFHVAHVRFLEKARALGDFLLVGCYTDETIHRKKGRNFPLQTLHERSLNILACRHVDDVLLSAPWEVSEDLLTSMNVSVVVTGSINVYAKGIEPGQPDPLGMGDPFLIPRRAGKFQLLESDCTLTMDVIVERIVDNAIAYASRQKGKERAESSYNRQKEFVAEH